MLYLVLPIVESVVRFIVDFTGTTGVRSPLFGDVIADWIRPKTVMPERF
mgnify:CR=1 FL=1